jgi:hypothetical protein
MTARRLTSRLEKTDFGNQDKKGGHTENVGFLWLAGLAPGPTFPGLHFQLTLGQELAGLAPAGLGDEVSIQVRGHSKKDEKNS